MFPPSFLNGLPYIGRGLFADGSATLPSIAFVTEPTLGIYRAGAGVIGFPKQTRFEDTVIFGGSGTAGVISWGGSGLLLRANSGYPDLIFEVNNGVEAARFKSGTNLLLGTTTDSGNGRLQLASHTTNSGGIGFGTDTTLFRDAANSLCTDGALRSKSATGGIGYAVGAGGTVTQLTSKATGVTLNKVCGQITMHNASLAAGTSVGFTVTNSAMGANDQVIITHAAVGTYGGYTFAVAPGAGSFNVYVRNNTAGALAEAIVLQFLIIKSSTT